MRGFNIKSLGVVPKAIFDGFLSGDLTFIKIVEMCKMFSLTFRIVYFI